MDRDLRLAQLLCSRLCHDLVGPAGAVGAGVEMMEEGGTLAADAFDLTARSARQVNARLAFYRAAFGFGRVGPDGGALDQAQALCKAYLAGRSVGLDWHDRGMSASAPPVTLKLLLNMVLMAETCLPRGGHVGVRLATLPGGLGCAVTARGEGARLRPELRSAAEDEAVEDGLSARTAPACFTGLLARSLNADLELADTRAGEVRIAALVPPASPPAGPRERKRPRSDG